MEVTLDENDPAKVLLKFKLGEMSDETGRASKPDYKQQRTRAGVSKSGATN